MSDILEGLDPQQMLAVTADPTPLLVIAPAGSGKTSVLTKRIVKQVEDGINPDEMFISAFTKAAAVEMGERIDSMLGEGVVTVGTFHSIMYRFINRIRSNRNLPRLGVCKEWEKEKIIVGLCGPTSKDFPKALNVSVDVAEVQARIGTWKNSLIHATDDEVLETARDAPDGSGMWAAAKVYPMYEAELAKLGKIDFDDMLIKAYDLLVEEPYALDVARCSWSSFYVDECQDTNRAQWSILNLIAPRESNPNVTIVGDPRQAIYAWRGALPNQLWEFQKEYKAKRVDLVRNYRSTNDVVRVANSLIKVMSMPDQVSFRGEGASVNVGVFSTPTEQAEEVARLVSYCRDNGMKGGDIAVLIRTNAQAADFEDAFVRAKLPYWSRSGSFFERQEIGDVVSYLRLAHRRDDVASLNRIINKPTRYLGKAFVEAVAERADRYTEGDLVKAIGATRSYGTRKLWDKQLKAARDLMDVLERLSDPNLSAIRAIDEVLRLTNYEEWMKRTIGSNDDADDSRKENLDTLKAVAARYGSVEMLLDFIDATNKLLRESGDSTEISTIHRSKGREWPVVVCSNFFEHSIPHRLSINEGDIMGERRLAYVAFTRAADHLFVGVPLTDSKDRTVNPSRFLHEASLELPADAEELVSEDWLDNFSLKVDIRK